MRAFQGAIENLGRTFSGYSLLAGVLVSFLDSVFAGVFVSVEVPEGEVEFEPPDPLEA